MSRKTDNTDLVPDKYEVAHIDSFSGARVYRCMKCGWKTPWVRNGVEFRDGVRQEHLCFPPRERV